MAGSALRRGLRVRSALTVTVVLLAGSLLALTLTSAGYPETSVSVQSGQAWLGSPAAGQVALIDGSTGDVVARIGVPGAGPTMNVAQQGGDAVVTGDGAGVWRIDGATWGVSSAQPLPGGQVRVLAGPHGLHAVSSSGAFVRLAPRTLKPLGPVTRTGRAIQLDAVVVDGGERVWSLGTDGSLNRMDGSGTPHLTTGLAGPGAALAASASGVVVADPAHRRVVAVEAGGEESVIPCSPGPGPLTVAASADGSTAVVASSPGGELTIVGLRRGSCRPAIRLTGGRADLGVPVVSEGRAFIPDRGTGVVYVVDLASGRVLAAAAVLAKGSAGLVLQSRDGVVFFNDENSKWAGIVRLDGSVERVSKYSSENPAAGNDGPGGTSDIKSVDDGKSGAAKSPAVSPLQVLIADMPATAGTLTALKVRSAAGEPLTTATWSFGDGSAAGSGIGVTHAWASAGTYQLSVRATTQGAGTRSWTGPVRVTPSRKTPIIGGGPGGGTNPRTPPLTIPPTTAPESVTLTVVVQGNGSVDIQTVPPSNPIPCTTTCQQTFTAGASVEVRAGQASGFQDWGGTCPTSSTAGGVAICSLTLAGTTSVTAVFSPRAAALEVLPRSGEVPLDVTADASGSAGFTKPVSYAFAWGDSSRDEGTEPKQTHTYKTAGPYTVTVTVTGSDGASSSATADITVADCTPVITTLDGPATAASDQVATFTASGNCLTSYEWTYLGPEGSFGRGETSSTFPFAVHIAGDYTVTATAMNAGRTGDSRTVNITITDAAPLPIIAIGGSPTFREGNSGQSTGSNYFSVLLSRSSAVPVTVDYHTAPDTSGSADATEGTDFIGTSGSLTFAPGELKKTVNVTIIGDTDPEPDEAFSFVMSNPVNADLGFAHAYGLIANDDH